MSFQTSCLPILSREAGDEIATVAMMQNPQPTLMVAFQVAEAVDVREVTSRSPRSQRDASAVGKDLLVDHWYALIASKTSTCLRL
jgi:hypothetical protein